MASTITPEMDVKVKISISTRNEMSFSRRVDGLLIPLISDKFRLFCILSLLLLISSSEATTNAAGINLQANDGFKGLGALSPLTHEKDVLEKYDSQEKRSHARTEVITQRLPRSRNSNNLPYNNRLSRALERIHFGPLLRLRPDVYGPVSNRAAPIQFASSSPETSPPYPREKKALSFFSRFYPVLQYSNGGGSDSILSSYQPQRRVSFQSGESFPVGRCSRPIMRLRWG